MRCESGATRRRALCLLAAVVAGLVLSLGPATPIYGALYRVFVPLQGLRAAARFGYLLLIADRGARRLRRRGDRAPPADRGALAMAFGIAALAAVTVEAWQGPVPRDAVCRDAVDLRAASWRDAGAPGGDAVLAGGGAVRERRVRLNTTGAGCRPLTGYGGYTPDSYRRRAASFWFFPEERAFWAMKREGITHVMVHLERSAPEADGVLRALALRKDVETLGSDDEGHRLYRLICEQRAPMSSLSRWRAVTHTRVCGPALR